MLFTNSSRDKRHRCIVELIGRGINTPTAIAKYLRINVAIVARDLQFLKSKNIVDFTTVGREHYYSINHDKINEQYLEMKKSLDGFQDFVDNFNEKKMMRVNNDD